MSSQNKKDYHKMSWEELDEVLIGLSNEFDEVKKTTTDVIQAIRKIRDAKYQEHREEEYVRKMSASDKERHLRVAGKIKGGKT